MTVPDWLKKWGAAGIAIALLVSAFLLGGDWRERQLVAARDEALVAQLVALAAAHEHVLVEKNTQVRTLEEALRNTTGMLSDKTSEAATLAELVTKLRKSGVRQVETITRVDTVFRPGEPVVIEVPVDRPAPDFDELVRWQNDVAVARVSMAAGTFSAEACELAFRLRGVQGEKDSAFLLFVRSSCDEAGRDVLIDEAAVTRVSDEKLKVLQARLGLGFSAGADIPAARPFFAGSLYLEWLHPHENVTLLAPQLSVGSHLAGGINLVGYNIGAPLPLVDDLWLHVGGGYGAPFTGAADRVPVPTGLGPPSWTAWLTVGTRL